MTISKNGFNYYQCHHCRIVFLPHYQPYEKFIKQFYTKGYFTGDQKLSAYCDYEKDKALTIKNYLPIIKHLERFLPDRGKHLDIGSAYGYFLQLTKNYGFQPLGIEPSAYAARIAQKKFNQQILNTSFEKAKLAQNSFKLITILDVLEHLSSPVKSLKKAYSLLQKEGWLVISTYDKDSLFARACGTNWHFYNPPQHLFIFSKSSLCAFLKKIGFTQIEVVKTGKWFSLLYLLHLARCIQKNKLAGKFFSLVKNSPIGNLPIYLRFNDLMLIYAKK